jgi:hypothetical protein
MHAWLPYTRRLFGFLSVLWRRILELVASSFQRLPANESVMPPTLLIIRHAQALHNADSMSPIHPRISARQRRANMGEESQVHLRDPGLSELGKEQSLQLRGHLKEFLSENAKRKPVGLIVSSPMRRTLQTALISLDWLIESGVRVLPDARWQGKPFLVVVSCGRVCAD